ncbi:MAG: hypothetical protein ABI556_03915 [Gemmatimonadales bacterium]
MTQNKDLKRLVRARMKKTGEAYTTARAQLTRKSKGKTAAESAPVSLPTPKPNPKNYAELAGRSDAVIKGKTGCAWEKWVKSLDHHGAESMSHTDIARMVHEKWKVDGWWAQCVTVGYERIKGLRAKGQRRDGSYEAGKSKTFNVPVADLYDAWIDARKRKRWLEADVKVRTATAPKSMRLGWSDGSIIAVGFIAKGNDKSSVALAHTKLPDRETSDRFKKYWSDRLDALTEILTPASRR